MTEFQYAESFDPPGPALRVRLGQTASGAHIDVLALLDTGADQNVVPAAIAARLRLAYIGDAKVLVYREGDKVEAEKPVYAGHIVIGDGLASGIMRWLEHDHEASQEYILIGRPILNQLVLYLHGPHLTGRIEAAS